MLAEQGNQRAIGAPDDVLHWRRGDFRNCLLLLNIVQDNRRRRTQDQASSSTVKDVICLYRGLDRLDYRIRKVANFDELEI